jgi:hypothetical protein
MQKAEATGSGKGTAQMAHCGGEDTTTTASCTESGSGTTPMAHWSGEPTGTTVSKRVLLRGGTLRAGALGRNII